MVTRIDSWLKQVGKERTISIRNSESHSHLKRNVAIVAVLSTALILGGFALFNRSSADARFHSLIKSGGVVMSASELTKYVKGEKIVAYWLGPRSNYEYTIIRTDPSEIMVVYLARGSKLINWKQDNFVVKTHEYSLTADRPLRSDINSEADDFMTTSGNSGSFSRTSLKKATFTIEPGMVVEIHYASFRTLHDVKVDGERLKRIW